MTREVSLPVLVQVRLPADLLARIDKLRQTMEVRPNRSQTIRFLLEKAMNILEEAGK